MTGRGSLAIALLALGLPAAAQCVVESSHGPKQAQLALPPEYREVQLPRPGPGPHMPTGSGSAISAGSGDGMWPAKTPGQVALFEAIDRGDAEGLRRALQDNPGLVAGPPGEFNRHAVNRAAKRGQLALMKLMVEHGAPLRELPGRMGEPSLAPIGWSYNGLIPALQRQPPGAARDEVGARYIEFMRYMLDAGAEATSGSLVGAARLPPFRGRRELTQLLLDRGARPTSHDATVGLAEVAKNLNEDWLELVPFGAGSVQTKNAVMVSFLLAGRAEVADRMVAAGANIHTAHAYPFGQGLAPLIALLPSLDDSARQRRIIAFYQRHGGDFELPLLSDGTTTLMRALRDPALVRMLLEAGAKPDARDTAGRTSLIVALDHAYVVPGEPGNPYAPRIEDARKRPEARLANARALLEHGADVNALQGGNTPLMLAYPFERELVALLFERGGTLRPGTDELSRTFSVARAFIGPLSWSILKGHAELPMRWLQREGHSLQADCGAAYYAALFDRVEVLQAIVATGPVPQLRDERGDDLLWAAARTDAAGTAAWLLDRGFGAASGKRPGGTLLMYAAGHGATQVVRILLARGADAAARDLRGRTAADHAIEARQFEAAAILGQAAPASR